MLAPTNYQFFLCKHTLALAGGHMVIPLSGEMGEAQKGCRRAKVRPYNRQEKQGEKGEDAPSVTNVTAPP